MQPATRPSDARAAAGMSARCTFNLASTSNAPNVGSTCSTANTRNHTGCDRQTPCTMPSRRWNTKRLNRGPYVRAENVLF